MLNIVRSNRFDKDLKLAVKRGFDMRLIDEVVTKLQKGMKLDEKYRDHTLLGNYNNLKECHIQPDWLLIYRIDEEEHELYLFRTGTHSDLF